MEFRQYPFYFKDGQAIALRLSRQIDNTVKKMKSLVDTYNGTAKSPIAYEEAINVDADCYVQSKNVIVLNYGIYLYFQCIKQYLSRGLILM